jgi:hypothetical protein
MFSGGAFGRKSAPAASSSFLSASANIAESILQDIAKDPSDQGIVKAGAKFAHYAINNSAPLETVKKLEPGIQNAASIKDVIGSNPKFAGAVSGLMSATGSVANAIPAVAVVNTVAHLLESPAGQKVLGAAAGILEDPGKFGEGLGKGVAAVGTGSGVFIDKTSEAMTNAVGRISKSTIVVTDDAIHNLITITKSSKEIIGNVFDTAALAQEKTIGIATAGVKGVGTVTETAQKTVGNIVVGAILAPFTMGSKGAQTLRASKVEAMSPEDRAKYESHLYKVQVDAQKEKWRAKGFTDEKINTLLETWEPTKAGGAGENDRITIVGVFKTALLILFIIFLILFIVYIASPDGCPDLYHPLLILGCVFILGFIAKQSLGIE